MKLTITSFALASLISLTMQAEDKVNATRFSSPYKAASGKTVMPKNHLKPVNSFPNLPDMRRNSPAEKREGALAILKSLNSNPLYRPSKQEVFYYERNKWYKDADYLYKYDSKGNIVEEKEVIEAESAYTLITYEYNSNNKAILAVTSSSENDLDYVEMKKEIHAYDPEVIDFETLMEVYNQENDEWLLTVGQRHDVERNTDGNVVKMTRSVYLPTEDKYDPILTMSLEYGEDGKASKISSDVLEFDGEKYFWRHAYDMTDIEWENTDGQIVRNVSDYMTMYFEGKNRIKSARMVEDGFGFGIKADYESNGNYIAVLNADDGQESVFKLTATDENGSFHWENTGTDFIEVLDITYDANGNVISEMQEYSELDEEGTVVTSEKFGQKYDYTYNDLGMPGELIISEYDMDNEKFVPVMRVVSSDYTDVSTGIEDVEIDFESDYEVYNLSGHRVMTSRGETELMQLPKGVYVVRQNGASVKVIR